jgi:hypothetical protein
VRARARASARVRARARVSKSLTLQWATGGDKQLPNCSQADRQPPSANCKPSTRPTPFPLPTPLWRRHRAVRTAPARSTHRDGAALVLPRRALTVRHIHVSDAEPHTQHTGSAGSVLVAVGGAVRARRGAIVDDFRASPLAACPLPRLRCRRRGRRRADLWLEERCHGDLRSGSVSLGRQPASQARGAACQAPPHPTD